MARNKNKKNAIPLTTGQALATLIKSARVIMRKDKGLNGDLDRLPLLTWIMFLKFLDDLEQQRHDEAKVAGKKFKAAIDVPYRWRDWAASPQGVTGDELLSFINQDETTLPNGKRGPGLFAYLRSLTSSNGDNRRDVIATVFHGVDNRMKSGYLLRDVVNKVNGIHFTSSEELGTLGMLYESMLREMRDAAGDSGEFYTPRPVVRFMVEAMSPRLGEIVLDPANGTGGFLVETYSYLSKQVKTVADRRKLQKESIYGCEAKPLPYLLCQMNLLLHGLDAPQIDPLNALRFKLSEIGEKDRVDVILTNPPFGGEEEKGIQGNFPEDRQTSETALLFLQLIMRKLRRKNTNIGNPSRAGVVVPESVMSDMGVAQRIRRQLIEEMNLHTVVRLPKGVFEPYSDIQTNLLFFDVLPRATGLWFYQVDVPPSRRNMRDPRFTASAPLSYDELGPLTHWYRKKTKNDNAWFVPYEKIIQDNYTLDYRNPAKREHDSPPLAQLCSDAKVLLDSTNSSINHITQSSLEVEKIAATSWPKVSLRELLVRQRDEAVVEENSEYKQITVKLYGRGVIERGVQLGKAIKTRPQFIAHAGDLIMSRIDARNGAFGIIPQDLEGALVTQDFPMFRIDFKRLVPEFLALVLKSEAFIDICKRASRGTTNRKRLKEELFLDETIPLPPTAVQKKLTLLGQEAMVLHQSASELSRISEKMEQVISGSSTN